MTNEEEISSVSQQLLFLLLDQIGDPVEIDLNAGMEVLSGTRVISLEIDEESGICTLELVEGPEEQ